MQHEQPTPTGEVAQEAARSAGYELVNEGKMKAGTLEAASGSPSGQEDLRPSCTEALARGCLAVGPHAQ